MKKVNNKDIYLWIKQHTTMASSASAVPFLQNFSLEGKVALITGGSGGK